MALVQCPFCGKRISSRAHTCAHCAQPLDGVSEQTLETHKTLQAIKKQQRVMSLSFITLLMFVGGFALMYLTDKNANPWVSPVSTALSATGFIGYVALRVWTIMAYRKKK